MKIVRTAHFDRSLKKLGATDADIAKLMAAILDRPEIGDVIPGLGGARKIRFAMKGRARAAADVRSILWSGEAMQRICCLPTANRSDRTCRTRSVP